MSRNLSDHVPFHTPADGGAVVSIAGDVYRVVAAGQQTQDRYALFAARITGGNGPPLHIHHREDEAFFVLEGDFEFQAAGRSIRAGAGDTLHMPRETPHTFRNRGESEGRLLILVTPAGLERYFEQVGTPLSSPDADPAPVTDADIQRLLSAAPDFGLEFPCDEGQA